jgi:D-beta-D-heptose 7-phosphate kinase/D-beta-D-heptose 1-phosphate adenosyltransferase
MGYEAIRSVLLSAVDQRILCVGDVMLDEYVHGKVSRISPEAPVPVLHHVRTEHMLGGVGNTACNLASLGARTRLLSIVGDDETGRMISRLLDEKSGVDGHMVVQSGFTSIRKIRLVSAGQQLMRLDHEDPVTLGEASETALLNALDDAFAGATAILVSDYAKGMITPNIMARLLEAAKDNNVPIIVDPKGHDIARYGAVDLIKPNARELSVITGLPTGSDLEVEVALIRAMDVSTAEAILVTRAAAGLSYLIRGGETVHMRGTARDVYDVSGAGDTSLAALGAALSAGAPLDTAAELALIASGIAVGKYGTASVSATEILSSKDDFLLTEETLYQTLSDWRATGRTIGFTNGCFDILHPGHLRVLEEAKARCGRLIVGLNSDTSVRALKGEGRPVNDQMTRARVLGGLSAVDGVVLFDEPTPQNLIERIKPDLLVKGGDYTLETIVGASEVLELGGSVHIVPLVVGHSTTATIARSQDS